MTTLEFCIKAYEDAIAYCEAHDDYEDYLIDNSLEHGICYFLQENGMQEDFYLPHDGYISVCPRNCYTKHLVIESLNFRLQYLLKLR